MEIVKYDAATVKAWLDAFRDGEREIENQTEVLERLNAKLIGLGAKEITDMPRSPSPPGDRLSDLINRKIELENELREDIEAHAKARQDILIIVKQLKSADERAVIRMRYLLCMSWNDVTDALFGGKEDYLDKEDSYQRRVHSVHGRALGGMAVVMERQLLPPVTQGSA